MNASNTTQTPKQIKAAKLLAEAMALLECTEKNVSRIIYALGIHDVCTRCGGAGKYSFCQSHGDTCFKCSGRGKYASALSAKALAAAAVKVADGTLVALRIEWKAKAEAKRSLGPKVCEAKAIYDTIGALYTTGSRAKCTIAESHAFVESPLFYAQTLNNSIYWDFMVSAFDAVTAGRRSDYLALSAQFDEALEMLRDLRDAYLAFAA